VGPDIRFEPSVVRRAVEAATGVDHARFIERLTEQIVEEAAKYPHPWSFMGAGRFLEDYLDPDLAETPSHARLVDAGLHGLAKSGALGVAMSVEILSPFERERLAALGHERAIP